MIYAISTLFRAPSKAVECKGNRDPQMPATGCQASGQTLKGVRMQDSGTPQAGGPGHWAETHMA